MAANAATCLGTTETTLSGSGERTYRVAYQVTTTDAADQGLTAIGASGIPSYGQFYNVGNDTDIGAYVADYSTRLISRDSSWKVWEVTVTFSTRPQSNDTQQPGQTTQWEYPWLVPARVSGSGFKQEKLLRSHYISPQGGGLEALASSAGEPYDDVYGEYAILGITIERDYYWEEWDIEEIRTYIDSVNSKTFWGAYPGYYKLAPPQYSLVYTGQGIPYWNVRYEFEGAAGRWNGDTHPDEGTYYRNSSNQIIRFADEYGFPLGKKGRLDGFGDKLSSVMPTVNNPPGGINRYLEADFADLKIPTSIENLIKGRN